MNPVSWTQKRSFYISKLSYEDKNNIYQERKKEDETKEEENKRKYSSYKGTVGKIADNLINGMRENLFGLLKTEMFYD